MISSVTILHLGCLNSLHQYYECSKEWTKQTCGNSMVKSQTSQRYWNLNWLWNMNILCTLSWKYFPYVPLSLKRKFITLRSKFKTIPGSNIWKKKTSGITYNSPLKIAHVTDWVANWLGRVASGGIRGGSLSIFLLLFHPSLFLFYLSIYRLSGIHHLVRGRGTW